MVKFFYGSKVFIYIYQYMKETIINFLTIGGSYV